MFTSIFPCQGLAGWLEHSGPLEAALAFACELTNAEDFQGLLAKQNRYVQAIMLFRRKNWGGLWWAVH